MIIKTAVYTGSFVDVRKCPSQDMGEFAFIGRSNVGKSSLINMLTDHNHLAKTSSTPGKTQTINYFLINKTWNLVDLPGYGFAKVSREKRGEWEKMINGYLIMRDQLLCVFQLIDAAVPPQKIDLEFTNKLGEDQIPFAIIFTKADRRKKPIAENIELYKKELAENWETLPPIFVSSAENRQGKEEILEYLDVILSSPSL